MKRVVDLIFATVLLMALAPLLALLALLIRVKLGRPVLFIQTRIGLDERPFRLLKFRTMTELRSPDGALLPDSDRMTPVGDWLRAWSLDELPQLWNVIRGEMSFIGPRPLLPEYLPRYSARHRKRHRVRPGLSGWAQVNGRNAIDWERRLELDIEYVERRTLAMEFSIVALTIRRLVRREGIVQPGQATMSEFRGLDSRG